MMQENSMILRQRAALGYLALPSTYEYSKSKRFDSQRFLPAACHTELIWHIRTRFLKIQLLQMNDEPPVIFENSRNMAPTSCGLVSQNTGRIAERANTLEKDPQNYAIPTPRFARTFSTWTPPPQAEGTVPQNCMIELPRKQVSELHVDKVPEPFCTSVLGN